MTNHIAILAIPRTGTNYLGDVISKLNEIDSLYEIFHKKSVYLGKNQQLNQEIINHINQRYNLSIDNIRSADFINFAHEKPQTFLDIIAQKSNNKYTSFKIFPNHLTREETRDIIIEDRQITKIIVKRNLLDAYLSNRILKVNQQGKIDTSEFKLEFDDNDFIEWLTFQNQYYNFLETELTKSGQEIRILQYETIHSHESNREKFQYILEFLQSVGLELNRNNLSNMTQKDLEKNVRKKQDKRNGRLEKLSNPNVLIDTLKSHQLESLLA
jgi:hypothetical protein